MLDQETIAQQLDLLAAYRRTLAALLQQQALLGGAAFAPPSVVNGIQEARTNIRRVKATLRDNQVTVDDFPDDEVPSDDQVLGDLRNSMSQGQIVVFERLILMIRQLIIQQQFVSEIKNIHNGLHNLKSSLNTIGSYIRTTKIHRRKLDLNFIEVRWKNSVVNCLENLRDFASKDLKYMGPVLVIAENEVIGPRWIIGLINLELSVHSWHS